MRPVEPKRARKTRAFVLALTGLMILAGYQNCAMQASHSGGGPLAQASQSVDGCDAPVATVFSQTYYPVVRAKCVGCHDNGEAGPARAFATSNFASAFEKFAGLGRAKVEAMMANAGHKPPFTGPQNQPVIDAARPAFAAAEAQAAVCTGTAALVTTAKAGPAAIYSAATVPAIRATWPKLTWDLEVDIADGKLTDFVHATIAIEVRRFVGSDGTAVGYEFKNPTFTIKAASPDKAYRIEALGLSLNGVDLATFTTYSLLKAVVAGTVATNLSGQLNVISAAPTPGPIAATDTFALRFGLIKATTEAAGSNIAGGDLGDDAPIERVTYQDLMSSNQAKGIFSANCQGCHNAQKASGSFDITTFTSAKGRQTAVRSRMNNVNLPMPPTGLLSFDQRKVIDAWIAAGTPEK